MKKKLTVNILKMIGPFVILQGILFAICMSEQSILEKIGIALVFAFAIAEACFLACGVIKGILRFLRISGTRWAQTGKFPFERFAAWMLPMLFILEILFTAKDPGSDCVIAAAVILVYALVFVFLAAKYRKTGREGSPASEAEKGSRLLAKTGNTFAVIAALTTAVLWVALFRHIPAYKAADQLYAEGRYEEAMADFETLGIFSDSKDRAEKCREMILQQEQQKEAAPEAAADPA